MPDPQLFLVSSEPVEGDDAERITLNGKPVGPAVHRSEVDAIIPWFTGYLSEQVRATMQRMGYPAELVQQTAHPVPAGPCPSCGRGPGGVIEEIVTAPCPVCRR